MNKEHPVFAKDGWLDQDPETAMTAVDDDSATLQTGPIMNIHRWHTQCNYSICMYIIGHRWKRDFPICNTDIRAYVQL